MRSTARPHRGRRLARGASTRSAALGLSVLIALGVIGTIVYFAITGATGPTPGAPTPPVDVEDLLGTSEESGRGMRIQITDKQDPTRLAAEVIAERYDPDGPSHRLVEEPRAWLFGRDGSSWYIEADRGRFFIPEGERSPRQGHLRGNVKARRYDPLPGGARPNPESTPPTLTATTDEPLRFDLDVLQFETDGRLHVVGEQIEFTGRGVFVVLNEQQESISWLRVDRGERLVYTPLDKREATDHGRGANRIVPARPTESGAGLWLVSNGAPPRSDPRLGAREGGSRISPVASVVQPPKIDHYRAVFRENVRATNGDRLIRSDVLTVWTRLEDNKFPDRTPTASATGPLHAVIASLAAAAFVDDTDEAADAGEPDKRNSLRDLLEPATPMKDETPEPADPADPADPAEPETDPADDRLTEPLILTWDGPMEVTPLDDAPIELSMGDDLTLRFEAMQGHVEFEDRSNGANGRALTVDYAAGRERIELTGSAGSVMLESPDAGRISGANSMYIELAAGFVHVPTAGELTGRDHTPGEESPQRIAWRDSADFDFAVEDGRMTDRIERASFRGGVRGANRDARLEGERLDAIFGGGPDESPRLVQLNVERALGDDGRGGQIRGDSLEVHFARGTHGEEIDPTRVIVTGSAVARREGAESIRAGFIDAALARDERGDVIVTDAEAGGGAEFTDGQGVTGHGEHLWADALDERAIITGDGARVTRTGSTITGPLIELDNTGRTVEVDGPGTFSHADGDGKSIEAAWTGRMSFDDLAGRVECVGGTRAESVSPDGTRDVVEAARLRIELDPASEQTRDAEQRLRRAIAFGTPESFASVESRRLSRVGSDDAVRVDEIFRLEGERIDLLAREDRLSVPSAGRLFILDRRPDSGGEGGGSLVGEGGRRGTTLFTWASSMDYDRSLGEAVFDDDVRVAHKPIDQPGITELMADRLVARFTTTVGGMDGELRWAEASTNAVLHTEGRREIAGDRLIYNAESGIVEAVAGEGGLVSMQDLVRGATSTARAIRWDLATDRIEIINPGSVVTPN